VNLREFFAANPKAAVAFSGGVDSAYLLYAAKAYGADVTAYYVKSIFQPQFELDDAHKLAEQLGAKLRIIESDVLSDRRIAENPSDRCYYCKRKIFEAITKAAHEDGYTLLLDGTNASDDASDRPGMRALAELSVRSPLRECSLTKAEIRRLSKEAGLPTWSKPAYACLATRIRTGEKITAEKLRTTEKAEAIMQDMGFSDFRVRMRGKDALVQIAEGQHADALMRESEIKAALADLYEKVEIDEVPRLRNIDLKELGL